MLSISVVLLENQELSSFEQLQECIKQYVRRGELFLEFDVRPPFPDTPEDWQDRLEAIFTSAADTSR